MNNKLSLILSVIALIGIIVSGVVRFQTVEGKVIKAEKTMAQIEEIRLITQEIENLQRKLDKKEETP